MKLFTAKEHAADCQCPRCKHEKLRKQKEAEAHVEPKVEHQSKIEKALRDLKK